MKVLNPRATNNPKNWLKPFAEYQSLLAIAIKAGEPTGSWGLQIPSTLKEKLKGGWLLAYSLNGKPFVVYVGYDADSAAAGIKKIAANYPRHLRGSKAPVKKVPKKSKPDPRKDPIWIRRIVAQYQEGIRLAHTALNAEEGERWFQKAYKAHIDFLNQRAGILNMSMRDYIFNSPMYAYWPNPPFSEEGLRNRLQEMEKVVADRERRAREAKEESK
jgi:hypothetical protein